MCLAPAFLYAAPLAGTTITNQATATYQDTATGLFATLSSNPVQTIVQPLEALTLTQSQVLLRPPGASVALSHRLTNTGNTTSVYAMSFSNLGADDYDVNNLALVRDVNSNGVEDSGEPVIANGATISLAAGAGADLVMTGLVAAGVPAGMNAQVRITAVSQLQAVSATNDDTITVSAGPNVTLSLSASPLSASPNQNVTLTVTGGNTGNGTATPIPVIVDGAAQSLIVVREAIPANTTFAGIIGAGTSLVRYHRVGDPLHTYQSVSPLAADIDAVAFTYSSLAAGQGVTLAFTVTAHPNATGTAAVMTSTYYHDGTANTVVNSNSVLLTFSGVGPALAYYTSNTFSSPTGIGTIAAPLFVQANASACNLDPTSVESHQIIVTSDLTGDTETLLATESAVNSGLFRVLPDLPTRHGDAHPVIAGNGILEVKQGDRVTAQLSGCGSALTTTTMLIDPNGTAFDARTNAPLSGITVTLIDVTGAGNGGNAGGSAMVFSVDGVTPAPSTVTTGVDGRYQFPLVPASTYRLTVTPSNGYSFPSTLPIALQPAGRNIHPSGSFGGTFQVTAATGPVNIDMPLDPGAAGGLFVEKTPSRSIVELADFVDYTVKVSNNSGFAFPSVTLTDNLPAGFAYVPGTARLNGAPLADPAGGRGPRVAFSIANVASAANVVVTYRVRVGPGAMQGDGINRVQAIGGTTVSNVATAKVTVQGGVFSDKGFIIGKIFMDCNRNRLQDREELGVPGVRVYMEDGTFAISDSEGKYTFFGVSPRTHVLKVDTTTLPAGSELITLANRNAGDAGSRFVDLKKGELHPADFAIGNCTQDLLKAVKARRAKGEVTIAEMERSALPLQPGQPGSLPVDPLSLPAGESILPRFDPTLPDTSVNTLNTQLFQDRTLNQNNTNLPKVPVQPAPLVTLDKLLPDLTPALAFVDFKDQDTLPIAQTNVRVKGLAGSSFTLIVNGVEIAQSRVGSKSVLHEKQVEAWEYIGINLKPGANTLQINQTDNFGNPRSQTVAVIAPDQLAKLKVSLPANGVPADGQTPAIIRVRLADAHGVPVTVRTPLTLEASAGRWQVEDVNKKEPGVQVFIEGGSAEYLLLPPQEPGEAVVKISSGIVMAEEKLSFTPNLRPLLAVGVLEGTLDLRKLNSNSFLPTRSQDGFEEELRNFTGNSSGTSQAGGRAALFLKGKIPGDALLTMGFDSDKDTKERLFRDIQPDEFYPVYGDSSVKGFEAQSTGRLYVRVDKNKSYLLYGDYITLSGNDSKTLGQYSRSLTGVKGHYENKSVSINAFASNESSRQIIEELPALGISGPYVVSKANALENSEKVEIITRDRNQPAVILKTVPQTRFADYAFEPLTGRVLFKAPVPSRDANLNPISIRVTYEIQEDGEKFWVAGVDGQAKITDRVEVGGSFVKDQNPQDSYQLQSGNVTVKLAEKTFLIAEVAQTDKQSVGTGNAARVELRHHSDDLEARIYAGQTDADFENPLASIGKGRKEAAAKATYKITQQTRLLGEAIHTEDVITKGKRDGVLLSVDHSFGNNFRLETGFRHARETAAPAQLSSITATPLSLTTALAKLSAPVPYIPQASIFVDYEQDVTSSRQLAGVGSEYQLTTQGRLYVRHEFLNSLSGPYALNNGQSQSATVVGLDTNYMKDGQVFSEYRARDAFSGREAQAAIGLRNRWPLAHGITANTSVERVQNVGGSGGTTGTALTGGIEYTRDPLWKGTARIEKRFDSTSDSVLNQVGIGYKLSRDWTVLGKNTFSMTENSPQGDKVLEHLRIGAAYRDTDTNLWNALGRYEFKYEQDSGQTALNSTRHVHILSTDLTFHPTRPMMMMGGYAMKWVTENSNGISSMYHAHQLNGRMTYDLTDRWDVGIVGSTLFSGAYESSQYSVGVEVGRVVAANVWVSIGYNFFGFQDRDLSPENYENQGTYIRLRMKFDEGLLSMLQ